MSYDLSIESPKVQGQKIEVNIVSEIAAENGSHLCMPRLTFDLKIDL